MVARLPDDPRLRDALVLALKRAIVETQLKAGGWKEIGYLTGTSGWITAHPRLLRSLDWGDNDYDEHVFDAIEHMLKQDPSNIDALLAFDGLGDWVRTHAPDAYAATGADEIGIATGAAVKQEAAVGAASAAKAYDIAISFAGEDRPSAEALAEHLRDRGVRVFYDRYEKATLWGKDLYTHLIDVYQNKARYCIMLLSQHYARKLWTNHERQAAQARAFTESREYILPIRLDDTDIPGILRTTGYLDWSAETPASIGDAVLEKLGTAPEATGAGSAPTTTATASIDEAMRRLLVPDNTPWSRLQRFVFSHRNVYERTLPPFYMIGLKPTTPMAPIPVTETEKGDEAFKRLCAELFGHVDAFMTDQDGIIFDPYTTGDATADDHPPYACAYIDGSIGLRDSISFTSRWEDKRPEPLSINLPGLWKMLRHALLTAEQWPREVGRYTGPLEVHLSLGNLGDTIISYPPDRLGTLPHAWNRVPQWDAARFAWPQGQNIDDLLEGHLASLARQLQFGAYPSYKEAIRAEAVD